MIDIRISILVVTLLAAHSLASEQAKLIVKKHPSYHAYNYESTDALRLTDFKQLLMAVNGYSSENIEWDGLKSTNSMASPKMTLLFLVDSQKSDLISGKSFSVNEDASANFDYLNKLEGKDSVVKAFNSLPTEEGLKSLDCTKDSAIYVFKVSGGVEDLNARINAVIQSVSANCAENVDDLLVYVLATSGDVKHETRSKRAVVENTLVRAIFYSDNYPVTFHLLFWTSLILGLAVVGVVCGMGGMDPGLDTVIYRMTSQRIKKDN